MNVGLLVIRSLRRHIKVTLMLDRSAEKRIKLHSLPVLKKNSQTSKSQHLEFEWCLETANEPSSRGQHNSCLASISQEWSNDLICEKSRSIQFEYKSEKIMHTHKRDPIPSTAKHLREDI